MTPPTDISPEEREARADLAANDNPNAAMDGWHYEDAHWSKHLRTALSILDAIQARLDAATPGPWHLETAGTPAGETAWGEVILRHHPAGGAGTPIPGLRVMWGGEVAVGRRNAALIAHAPTDIAALLAECRVLRERVVKLERVADAARGFEAQVFLAGQASVGIFTIAAVHGAKYHGPTFAAEANALTAALRALNDQEPE